MTDEEEYEAIQKVLKEGSIASSLLETGSEFLHAVENLRETYKEAIFETDKPEDREQIYLKMKVMDELIHDLAIAQVKGHKITQYLEEQDAEQIETETEE